MKNEKPLLRLADTLDLLRISRSTLLRGVKDGRYPRPFKISKNINVWRREDLLMMISFLPINNLNLREASDGYQNVICNIVGRYRVILCKHDLQWIIQICDGTRRGRRRWAGQHYVTSKPRLIELCRTIQGFSEENHGLILSQLPSKCTEKCHE